MPQALRRRSVEVSTSRSGVRVASRREAELLTICGLVRLRIRGLILPAEISAMSSG
ncbi:hypothetical protein [Nostoc sp.]|uniref:hypothetical protein n=1 Tax=Nostoc sp. TaxID=1180 RepID=UPI002FF766D5